MVNEERTPRRESGESRGWTLEKRRVRPPTSSGVLGERPKSRTCPVCNKGVRILIQGTKSQESPPTPKGNVPRDLGPDPGKTRPVTTSQDPPP